ncbi:hypothetical protein MAR_019952 [Mya arenaria]|uniref:Uncharacterized protein n=1 Tax=Mya arenaria TaxID=6604 RepID=A0ABY7E747_MYAAR|nr:hypothetical protein MAR_019952 [Mya arenaria]
MRECTRTNRDDVQALAQQHSAFVYNKFMGGVDRHDQHRTKNNVERCSKKWWRRTKKRYTHKDFREELFKELIAGYRKRKRNTMDGPLNQQPMMTLDTLVNHSHEHRGQLKDMQVAQKRTVDRHETVYGCVTCNVHLCRDCFVVYLTRLGLQAA